MKLDIFTVYDSKAGCYLQPFFALTRGHALRMFQNAVNDAGHDFYKYSEDFTLFAVGEFHQVDGKFELRNMESLGTALQYKEVASDG